MKAPAELIAIAQLGFVLPATLFMSALFLRAVQPLLYPGRVVAWFAGHFALGLGLCLVLMPLMALVVGCTVLLRAWQRDSQFRVATSQFLNLMRAQWPVVMIAGTTLLATGVLFLVGLHMLTE